MPFSDSGASMRSRGRNWSGSITSSAKALIRARNSGTRAASIVRPAACLWPPNLMKTSEQLLERREDVEVRNAAARAVRDVAVDRQHDGRLVVRVDQLRGRDADDAAVPARGRRRRGRCARPTAGSVSIAFFACVTSSASSCWRRVFSSQSCCASARASSAIALVGSEQQPRGDVGRAHAPGGVDARREQEPDVIAVDRLAGEAGCVEQRAQADRVRPLRQRRQAVPRDHAVLADERHHVGERADGGDLDEGRQPLAFPGPCAQRLHDLQRDADAGEVLVGVGAVGPLGIDDRQRRRAACPRARGGR